MLIRFHIVKLRCTRIVCVVYITDRAPLSRAASKKLLTTTSRIRDKSYIAENDTEFHHVKPSYPQNQDGEYRVQVLDRTFGILASLAATQAPLSAVDIARRLQLNKSTIHRLLAVLERHRYVERDLETGRYRLGNQDELVDRNGETYISRQDFAIAVIDMAESRTVTGKRVAVGPPY